MSRSSKSPSLAAFCNAPSSDLLQLLSKVYRIPESGDRRSESRIPQSLFLAVQPLNNSFEPVGESFRALSRDISSAGIGFLFKSAFPTNFVRVGPNEHSPSQTLGRVCYNKAVFNTEPTFLVGVEFLDNSHAKE